MSGRHVDPWEVRVYRLLLRLLPGALFRMHGDAMAGLLRDRLRDVGPRLRLRLALLAGALWDAVRHGAARPARPSAGILPGAGTLAGSTIQDLRFSLRSLRRRPLFAAVSVVTLALGIGGTTAIFSVVDGVLLKRLPYRDPHAVVSVWRAWPDWRGEEVLDYVWDHIQFPLEDYLRLRDGARTLTDVEAAVHGRVPFSADGRTEEIGVGLATAGLLGMLGVRPVLGRTFAEDEALAAPAGARVALLSHQLWTRRFGADPGVLGHTLVLGGAPYEVIGVLPERFRLPSDLVTINDNAGAADDGLRDVWLPLGRDRGQCGNCLEVLARLAPGHTLDEARAEVRTFVTEGPAHQIGRVEPRRAYLTRGAATPLLVLLAAAGMLLLIACLNVAGLLVGEATGRRQEIAVRYALGARRGRLARQLLTESALLGVLGAGAGLVLAWLGTDALLAVAPPLPRLEEVRVSGRMFAFAAAAGLATGLLFGLAPTLGLLGGRGVAARRREATRGSGVRNLHAGVVTLQVGLTVTLLVAGGLFGTSLTRLMAVDPGFAPAGLATLSFAVPPARRAQDDGATRFQADVIRAVQRLPGVTAATATNQLPFPGGHFSNGFTIERAGASLRTTFWNRSVLPGYFEALGIPLLQGRLLSDADRPGAPDVVVVSRSLAERSWPGESPLGKEITNGEGTWTVVGVVGDVHQRTLSAAPQPTFYRSLLQRPEARLYLAARTGGDPAAVIGTMRQAIWALDPATSITDAGVMSVLMRDSEADDRFRALLVRTFAALATALAAVGIFGVTARGVATRTRELGIRAALGATGGGLVRLVVREGLASAAAGIALGLLGARAAAGGIRHLLFGVDPHDSGIFARVAVLALAVCVVAAWIPARRATRIDPRQAIAEE